MTVDAFADADSYDGWFGTPLGAFVGDLQRRALERALENTTSGVVIDIGAGTGHFTTVAQEHQVIAVEPSAAMSSVGRHQSAGSTIHWCAGVGERLPLASVSVDGAMIVTALEWATDPAAWFTEVRRVVRPGGWLVMVILSALSPWAALYRRKADEGLEPWRSARFFTSEEVADLVGTPPVWSESVVHLAPQAHEPWSEAEKAGRRAGNPPALEVLRWNITN